MNEKIDSPLPARVRKGIKDVKDNTLHLHAFEIWETSDMEVPALIARIPAGEPMELCSEIELVDLNYLLTRNSPNSLILRVDGESMCPEIKDGDWIIVSRGLQPEIGDIVVASVNGAHTLKRLKANDARGRNGLYLVPSNSAMQPREMTASDNFLVLGVVTRIISNTRHL
jgi:DNA polymerase V